MDGLNVQSAEETLIGRGFLQKPFLPCGRGLLQTFLAMIRIKNEYFLFSNPLFHDKSLDVAKEPYKQYQNFDIVYN